MGRANRPENAPQPRVRCVLWAGEGAAGVSAVTKCCGRGAYCKTSASSRVQRCCGLVGRAGAGTRRLYDKLSENRPHKESSLKWHVVAIEGSKQASRELTKPISLDHQRKFSELVPSRQDCVAAGSVPSHLKEEAIRSRKLSGCRGWRSQLRAGAAQRAADCGRQQQQQQQSALKAAADHAHYRLLAMEHDPNEGHSMNFMRAAMAGNDAAPVRPKEEPKPLAKPLEIRGGRR